MDHERSHYYRYEPLQVAPAPAGLYVVYVHRTEDGSEVFQKEPALALAVMRVTRHRVNDAPARPEDEPYEEKPYNEVHALVEGDGGHLWSAKEAENFVGLLLPGEELAARYGKRPRATT